MIRKLMWIQLGDDGDDDYDWDHKHGDHGDNGDHGDHGDHGDDDYDCDEDRPRVGREGDAEQVDQRHNRATQVL